VIVDELFVELGVEVDTSSIDKAKDFFDRITNLFGKLPVAGMVAAGAIAGVGAALIGVANQVAKADEIGDLAEKLGVGAEGLQAWQAAANVADVGLSEFNSSLDMFIRKVGQARAGNEEAQKSLAGLNLTNEDGSTRDVLDIYQELIKTVSELPGPAERSAKLFEVLGRQGQNVLPLVNQEFAKTAAYLNEFKESKLGFGAEAVAEAGLADRALKELQMVANALLKSLFGTPEAMRAFRKVVEATTLIVKKGLLPVFKALGTVLGFVLTVFGKIFDVVAGLVELFAENWKAVTAISGAVAALFVIMNVGLIDAILSAVVLSGIFAAWIAPFLLAAAAVGLLFLVIEDLVKWSQGKKSLFGNLFNALTQVDWSTLGKDVGHMFLTGFLAAFTEGLKFLANVFGMEGIARDIQKFQDNRDAAGQTTAQALFSGGASSPAAAQSMSTPNASTSLVSSPQIVINASGLSEEQLKRAAAGAITEANEKAYSDALSSTTRQP
jgi:hypothetical protein